MRKTLPSDRPVPTTLTYPFTPKSNSSLVPGHFWAVPLSDGSFACGRVIQLPPKARPGARTAFLAGLLNWHSPCPPTPESIAGACCLAQGDAHVKTITETGGAILGYRPLEADGITPLLFRDRQYLPGSLVQEGYQVLRRATHNDAGLPVFTTWGFRVISVLAEAQFLGRPADGA